LRTEARPLAELTATARAPELYVRHRGIELAADVEEILRSAGAVIARLELEHHERLPRNLTGEIDHPPVRTGPNLPEHVERARGSFANSDVEAWVRHD